jgi:hypothetical protein
MFLAIAMWMYGSPSAYTRWPPLWLIEVASATASHDKEGNGGNERPHAIDP